MKATVVTATTGNPILFKCLESVFLQKHNNIQHLLVIDGPDHYEKVRKIIEDFDNDVRYRGKESSKDGYRLDIIYLPYSIGKDRWNGHRIYAAGSYIADGDYLMFLDDDNFIENTHIQDCFKVISEGNSWAYSFRKIVSSNGNFLCLDDCESLGKWASVLHPQDYFVDVNCYFLSKKIAIDLSSIWNRKAREPGQPEVDRVLCQALRTYFPKFDSTYNYTVNYTAGNTELSVTPQFFVKGNAEMLRRYNGDLPWKK